MQEKVDNRHRAVRNNGGLQKTKRKVRYQREHRPIEFKLKAVQMVESANEVAGVARELGIPVQSLHNWVKAYQIGKLGAKVRLTPEECTYILSLCTKRATELKSSSQASNKRNQQELNKLGRLLPKLRDKELSPIDA